MNTEQQEKWIRFREHVFKDFAEIFQYSIYFMLLILAQFALLEFLIFSSSDEHKDSLILYGIRFSLLLSAFCYGYANRSCASYINSNFERKYRVRANRTFWTGVFLFVLPALYLLFMCLLAE